LGERRLVNDAQRADVPRRRGGDQGLGEVGLNLLLDRAGVPGRGGDELLERPDLPIGEDKSDGFGVLAAIVPEQPTQVGEGMVLGGLVAEERGEPLVQFGQAAGGGAYFVRRHEPVLLDDGENDLIRTGPPDFDANLYCKLRPFWVVQITRCRSRYQWDKPGGSLRGFSETKASSHPSKRIERLSN
jgi:hypothetical protein